MVKNFNLKSKKPWEENFLLSLGEPKRWLKESLEEVGDQSSAQTAPKVAENIANNRKTSTI